MSTADGGMHRAEGGAMASGSPHDPCADDAMCAEVRANARAERALIGIGLIAGAATAAALVLRGLVS
jgi:hypothetical protein